MNIVKRLGLTALCVVGVTLLASAPAWARETYKFKLVAVGDEPEATGKANVVVTFKGVNGAGDSVLSFKASVTCQGLTPGATYVSAAGTFTANSSGSGGARRTWVITVPPQPWDDSWGNPGWWGGFEVWRLNPDGTSTLVLAAP